MFSEEHKDTEILDTLTNRKQVLLGGGKRKVETDMFDCKKRREHTVGIMWKNLCQNLKVNKQTVKVMFEFVY